MPEAACLAASLVYLVFPPIMQNDTIAAIATPLGTGGISIIKVSGPDAVNSVLPVFLPSNANRVLTQVPSQTMVYGHIHEPASGDLIDEVLLTILRGPRSFTGEDVVEINCHGGPQVTSAVLDILIESGLRLADPGEFTRRAFINGRIDLTQVEGTIDLIHARTRRAARLGSQMIAKGIGDEINRLLDFVLDKRAMIEASIDFEEEIDDQLTLSSLKAQITEQLIPPVEKLIQHYRDGRLLRDGLRVVLAGKPNVGKSSLMNQLLNQDRVIVTDVPGTTRDTIEAGMAIDGVPIMLIDTAGIRTSEDPVELLGQMKSREAIEKADLILFMMDASQPIDGSDREQIDGLGDQPYLVLRNKIDLVKDIDQRTKLDETPIEGYLDISALQGKGLTQLKQRLLSAAGVDQRAEAEATLPNLRQKRLLQKIINTLTMAVDPDSGVETIDMLALDLKDCERAFNQILGADVAPDVLDEIFSRFCIGK